MSYSLVNDTVAAQILASCTDEDGYVDYEAYDLMMEQEAAANENS